MAYSQLQKLETSMHIQASSEHFCDVYWNRTHHIANIFPEKIHSIEINEGEWGTEGSIVTWNYYLGKELRLQTSSSKQGKTCAAKVVAESIDRKDNKMTFKVIDGDLLQYYKSFKFILQVTPKEKGSIACMVLEYEKQQDHFPDPHIMLQLTAEVMKKVDADYKDQN
ncbi:MLP-like protein 43, partial [Mucuna pruriens]